MFGLKNSLTPTNAGTLVFRIIGIATIAVLTGCGGGGASSSTLPQVASTPTALTGGSNSSASANAKLTITIPASSTASKLRRAQYVSSNTNSATFTPDGGATTVIPLTSSSPNCTVVSGGRSCTISVSVSGTSVSFTISTYASSNGTGSALSTTHATETIVPNQLNTISVTLNAIVNALQISASPSSFTIGSAASATVNVNVLDASGAIIAVGPNNLVDANDNPVTIALKDSETSATHLSATTLSATPVTLSYSGGTPSIGTAVISATASSSASASVATAATNVTIASSGSGGALPPFGVYTSCEIDSNLAGCEAQDLKMTQYGLTMEINYLSTAAHKTGSNSLQSWAQYDAGIGMMQWINLKNALNDSDALTGNSLAGGSLGADCGATTNKQVIQCIESTLSAVPGFNYGWYIYDEPGCPEAIGYCYASVSAGHYKNIEELAAYITSISSHPVLGIQAGGATSGEANMFSCNGGCGATYYITSPNSPNTGGDDYPISGDPVATKAGLQGIGTNVSAIEAVLSGPTSGNPNETFSWVGQAFSWYQESSPGSFSCTNMTTCPMITQTQLQEQRDEALYYAKAGGKPIKYFFWYYWPDLNCMGSNNNVNGVTPNCNATTNLNAVKAADQAPFPTTPPVIQ